MPTRPTTSTDTKTRHLHRLQWVRRGNLKAAETAGRLTSKLGSYLRPSVLAVDEVSKRYEKGSTRPSANGVRSLATKSAPPRSSTALHHCEVVPLNGPSYRLENRLRAIERAPAT